MILKLSQCSRNSGISQECSPINICNRQYKLVLVRNIFQADYLFIYFQFFADVVRKTDYFVGFSSDKLVTFTSETDVFIQIKFEKSKKRTN